ncbi:MAG: helix-turn-helix domain-containing protein [Acidobacteriota bacterium]
MTPDSNECRKDFLAIRDALDILSGKWKIMIIVSLFFGKKRFKELERDVEGITAKMLSKELRDLEMNKIVKRTVFDTKPVTVEYEITEHGKSLEKLVRELIAWGICHRKRIFENQD